MHGRDLLRHGLIWRVGDGTNINIFHGNWIPRDGCLTPLGGSFYPSITKVRDLLNDHGDGWDEHPEREAKEIQKITVDGLGTEDFRA